MEMWRELDWAHTAQGEKQKIRQKLTGGECRLEVAMPHLAFWNHVKQLLWQITPDSLLTTIFLQAVWEAPRQCEKCQ